MTDESNVKTKVDETKKVVHREVNEGEKKAEAWNQKHPEGTPVTVDYEGETYSSNTKSLAGTMYGEAIIYVMCFPFTIPLSAVTAVGGKKRGRPKGSKNK